MYQILFVEDESYMLDLLEMSIEWESLGFHVAGKFENGKAAMAYIQTHRVDAVISDISMPHISGIELCKYCHEHYPHIKLALISAYRKFDYAKEAISYNVVAYLTKPIVYEELYQTALSIKKQLDDSKSTPEFSMENSDLIMQFQDCISDLYSGLFASKEALQNHLYKIGIDINAEQAECTLIHIQLENFHKYLDSVWKYGKNRFHTALNQILSLRIDSFYIAILRFYKNTIEILAVSDDTGKNIAGLCEILKSRLDDFLKLEFSITADSPFRLTDKLNNAGIEPADTKQRQADSVNSVILAAQKYANENYMNAVTLTDVASHVHMNEIYFCAYYKKKTGISYITYLTQVRINKAKELLADEKIKISSINLMIGYKNKSHFYNVFKEYSNGLTPLEYRQLLVKDCTDDE